MSYELTERLQSLAGTPRVVRIERRPASQPVYNLEVQLDHVYHVGSCGLLVHNGTTRLDDCFRGRFVNGTVDNPVQLGGTQGPLIRGSNPSRLVFEGTEVRAVRDLSHVNESTLRAMAKDEFAAKDINGNKLILHHLNQNPNGPIVEVPGFRHSIHNPIQHPLGNAPGVGLTQAQREAFNGFRTRYWKARALEELMRRGLAP